MVRKSVVILLMGLLASASPALADGGTLGKGPGAEWATPMSERELQGIRGGMFGVAFSLFFEGFVGDRSNVTGALINDPSGSTGLAPPPEFSVDDEGVTVRTALGSFNGANGIFQVNQVPGNFNVVHNNLFIQITMVTLQNSTSLPSLSSLLQPTR